MNFNQSRLDEATQPTSTYRVKDKPTAVLVVRKLDNARFIAVWDLTGRQAFDSLTASIAEIKAKVKEVFGSSKLIPVGKRDYLGLEGGMITEGESNDSPEDEIIQRLISEGKGFDPCNRDHLAILAEGYDPSNYDQRVDSGNLD